MGRARDVAGLMQQRLRLLGVHVVLPFRETAKRVGFVLESKSNELSRSIKCADCVEPTSFHGRCPKRLGALAKACDMVRLTA
jgi:primosomal protein N'